MSSDMREAIQMMQNSQQMQKDIQDAFALAQNMLQEKYVTRLAKAVQSQHQQALEAPSKEVQLMQAMKAFLPPHRHGQIDRMIDTFILMGVTQTMQAQFAPRPPHPSRSSHPLSASEAATMPGQFHAPPEHFDTQSSHDASVHADGVYDMDYACLNQKKQPAAVAPEMLAFLLFLMPFGQS